MKKIILLFFITICFSCTQKKKYQYVLTVMDEKLSGITEKVQNEPLLFESLSDSTAILDAYLKFSIAKKSNLDFKEAKVRTYTTPLSYILLNDKGEDITNDMHKYDIKKSLSSIDSTVSLFESSIKEIVKNIKAEIKVDSSEINRLKPLFKSKTDEFSPDKNVWITPLVSPKYRNMNGTYCYFSQNNLRFVFQYHDDDWLFIRKLQFLIDDVAFEYIPVEIKRDNDRTGITEWFDEQVSFRNNELIEALAKAKKVKIKLIGDNYVDYRTVSAKEILSIKNTLDYYKALGYTF